jgi:hypothetical protein
VSTERITTGDKRDHGDKSIGAMIFHFLLPRLPHAPVVVPIRAIANRSKIFARSSFPPSKNASNYPSPVVFGADGVRRRLRG